MKRIICMLLIGALCVSMLVGCGNSTSNTPKDEANNTIKDETNNDTSNNESENSGVVGDVIGSTEENTENNNTEDLEVVIVRVYIFPESYQISGYTKKTLENEYSDWSKNESYVKFPNGNEMTFYWEGPVEAGEYVYENSTGETISIKNKRNNIGLAAWTEPWYDTAVEELKGLENKEILNNMLSKGNMVCTENSYINLEETNDYVKLIFGFEDEKDNEKGYQVWIAHKTNKLIYQFKYYEDSNIYNDVRAFDVINSIEYREVPETPPKNPNE